MGVSYEWKNPSIDHVEIVGTGTALGDGVVDDGCLGVAISDGGGGIVIEDTLEGLREFAHTVLRHTGSDGPS